MTEPAVMTFHFKPARRQFLFSVRYARHGRDSCGVQGPCAGLGTSNNSVYQMNALRTQVLYEGNCIWATEPGKEACDRVRNRRVSFSPPRRDRDKSARLRTETSYEAAPVRRVSTTSRRRAQAIRKKRGTIPRDAVNTKSLRSFHEVLCPLRRLTGMLRGAFPGRSRSLSESGAPG
jgi:hypothetical protein